MRQCDIGCIFIDNGELGILKELLLERRVRSFDVRVAGIYDLILNQVIERERPFQHNFLREVPRCGHLYIFILLFSADLVLVQLV